MLFWPGATLSKSIDKPRCDGQAVLLGNEILLNSEFVKRLHKLTRMVDRTHSQEQQYGTLLDLKTTRQRSAFTVTDSS